MTRTSLLLVELNFRCGMQELRCASIEFMSAGMIFYVPFHRTCWIFSLQKFPTGHSPYGTVDWSALSSGYKSFLQAKGLVTIAGPTTKKVIRRNSALL
jgi:hypothetical protein